MVCLARHLDYPSVRIEAIADVIEYGRNSVEISFNAVLISIEHVVLIKSLLDGSVDHAELLCLIPITSNSPLQARRISERHDRGIEPFHKRAGLAWLLPPNTVCYFGTKQSSRSKRGADDMKSSNDMDSWDDMKSDTGMEILRNTKYFHYLYLRLKRANKY